MTIESKHNSCRHISWTAIFVGAFVGIGLSFLLNLFGIAIGLHTFNVQQGTGTVALALSGFIAIAIGIIITGLVAGYIAGYLGRLHCPEHNLGVIYGFTTWTVALLLSGLITAHISHSLTDYSTTISNSLPTVSVGVSSSDTNNKTTLKLRDYCVNLSS